MKALARWSVNNRVTVNLIMVFIIMAGLFTVLNMRREMFPQFALDMVNVSVIYPGASPQEVEEGICIKIEEQIKGVEGISKIRSGSYEGLGSVTVELDTNADLQTVMDDMKTQVDLIDTFPDEAEDPVVVEIINKDPTITVGVYGDVSEKALRKTAEKIRDDLINTGPISLVELVGVREYEISVEVSEEDLRRYSLSFDQVVAAVRTGSIDLPGGTIKTKRGEILVKSMGQLYTGAEFEKLPLITFPDGAVLYLGDVARINDGFEDADIRTKFNGKPAVMVRVNRTKHEDVIKISDTVRAYVAANQDGLPGGVRISTWFDISVMVRDRINLLLRNGTQGIILVFIVLSLFLNLRLAFWVAVGIPISFMGAFLVLDYNGATVNMISLFAFIMTLGILVDDAIIVGENIFSHYERGKNHTNAVVDGLAEVGSPVVMAIATTVVGFTPLLFISGIMGKFIAVMPAAVISILLFSLLEALIILPAHLDGALARTRRQGEKIRGWHAGIRAWIENTMDAFINEVYAPALNYVVKNRYFAFSIGIGVLIISLGIIRGGYVPFVFMPKGESDWIIAEVYYPLGTPIELTSGAIAHVEKSAFKLDALYKDKKIRGGRLVTNVYSMVGKIPRRDWKPTVRGGHCGEIWIELASSADRPDISVNGVIREWRKLVGEVPGVEQLSFFTIEGGPAGNPIEIQLGGNNFDQLQQAADELKTELSSYPGTFDVTDTFKPGKEEKQVEILPGARSVGISMMDLARQLRQAFYGEEAVRIQRGRDDLKVMVRYAEKERRSLSGIENMRIRTADGRQIPIEEVASIKTGRAYSTVRRVDRQRVITVSADLDENVANASRIVASLKEDFLPDLAARYPGLKYGLEGQEKRTRESLDSLKKGFALAMMGIFLLLASQFRSYIQPIIVMMAIPFGLIGAIGGHLVMGLPFTMISIFGIVALSGIVVNDSLILIDFINRAGRSGVEIQKAVVASGIARFRPVLLTTLTTIAGLFPLLLERSFQAQFLIPMAVSISFGLLVATLLTLLYVPALYLIIQDIVHATAGRFRGIEGSSDIGSKS